MASAPTTAASGRGRVLAALALGALVALSLGVYGKVHDPTGRSLVTLVFTKSINLRVGSRPRR